MTNKIQISRELAERMLEHCSLGYYGDELRAILATQSIERQEPVAYLACGELFKTTMGARNYAGSMPIYPLYTSPPAPVSVVLPERDNSVHTNFEPADSWYTHGWNDCLDKVKELNQSPAPASFVVDLPKPHIASFHESPDGGGMLNFSLYMHGSIVEAVLAAGGKVKGD